MAGSIEITSFLLGYIYFLNYFVRLNQSEILYYDETYTSYTIYVPVFIMSRTII